MRHPTWDDIRRFCEVDGWEPTHVAQGRKRRDHDRFTKTLPDGQILRTRASHGNDEIRDPGLVNHIIKRQLQVTHKQFWAAVDNGVPPDRSQPEPPTPDAEAPAHELEDWLAVNLAVNVGLRDDEIAAMSPDEAMERWLDWCARKDQ